MIDFLKKYRIILLLSCLSICTLGEALLTLHFDPTISRDGLLYIYMSRDYSWSYGFQAILKAWPRTWMPPLPICLTGVLYCSGMPLEVAAVFFNILFGCLMPWIIYGIAWELTARREIALGAALLMTVAPSVIEISVQAQRDMSYLFFSAVMIYFTVKGIKYRKFYQWGMVGIFFSLALLSRYETWEMILIGGLVLLVVLLKDTKYWKTHLLNTMVTIISAVFTVILFAWLTNSGDYIKQRYPYYYKGKFNVVKMMYRGEGK